MDTFLALFVTGSLIYTVVTGLMSFLRSGTRNYKRSRNGFIAFLVSFICLGIYVADNETEAESSAEQVEEMKEDNLVQEEDMDIQEEISQKESEEEEAEEEATQEENTLTSFTNIIQSLDRDEIRQIVRESVEARQGNNFSMIESVIDSQMEAYDWLSELEADSEAAAEILESVLSTWGIDFEMVQSEYEQYIESFNSLHDE